MFLSVYFFKEAKWRIKRLEKRFNKIDVMIREPHTHDTMLNGPDNRFKSECSRVRKSEYKSYYATVTNIKNNDKT